MSLSHYLFSRLSSSLLFFSSSCFLNPLFGFSLLYVSFLLMSLLFYLILLLSQFFIFSSSLFFYSYLYFFFFCLFSVFLISTFIYLFLLLLYLSFIIFPLPCFLILSCLYYSISKFYILLVLSFPLSFISFSLPFPPTLLSLFFSDFPLLPILTSHLFSLPSPFVLPSPAPHCPSPTPDPPLGLPNTLPTTPCLCLLEEGKAGSESSLLLAFTRPHNLPLPPYNTAHHPTPHLLHPLLQRLSFPLHHTSFSLMICCN